MNAAAATFLLMEIPFVRETLENDTALLDGQA
jgi:hypothetical protein